MDDKDFALLKRRIEKLLSLDLECYKPVQVERRLESFIGRNGNLPPAAFARKIEQDPQLLDDLRDMLTINVTEFYRDPIQWKRMETDILPALVAQRPRLKIWSAGCSQGAEPYTVAMLMDKLGYHVRGRILATDFDRRILKQAKAGGPYGPDDVRNLPRPLLTTYFETNGDVRHVSAAMRRRVEFSELNLLTDRFDDGFDLIMCRNVVIYFEEQIKRELFKRFHAALAPGGALFIGSTETILAADAIGFSRMGGNFYQRPAETTLKRRSAA